MTTKKQAQVKRERYAAMLLGTQLLELAVREAAKADGVPLPPGNILSQQQKSLLSIGSGSADVPVRQGRPISEIGRKPLLSGGQPGCAIIGCKNPHRTKGYCAAHYQKLRMLVKTNRRPADWTDYAKAGTVKDLKMPRGRAASKALAELRAKNGRR